MSTTDDYNVTVVTAEFHPNGYQVATVIWIIITFLIVVTIVFEAIKDYAIENSNKYTRPITLILFSEMTLLGWLSICAFTFDYTGYLDIWSEELFGSDATSYIYHKMCDVQYFIFLILVLIIIQVFILLSIASAYTAKFDTFNEVSQDKEEMIKLIKEVDEIENTTWASWTVDYLCNPLSAWEKHNRRIEVEETVLFYALRKEHCLRRSPIPPYLPEHKSRQLPTNFDYAHYLSLCLSKFLKSVTTLSPATWLVTLLFFFLMYGILVGCDGDYVIYAGVWIGIGYFDMFLLMILESRTHFIFEHLMNPVHLQKLENELERDKAKSNKKNVHHEDFTLDTYDDDLEQLDGVHPDSHSSLVKRMKNKASEMPMYTSLEPTAPSTLSAVLTDPIPPNRHEQLFFGDKLGPDMNIMFVRMHLVVQSVYLAFAVVFFLPLLFADYGWEYGLGFLALILLPFPIQYLGFYGRLIVEMSHSQNTGCLKAKDTEVDTMKDQRAEQVVGLMLMLTKLASKHKGEKKKNSGISTTERIKEVKNPHLKAEIQKLTTLYDRWGKGKPQGIPESDLQGLLLAMGMHYNGRNLDKLVLEIDTNHDGFISLDDLIEWRLDAYGTKAHKEEEEEEGEEGGGGEEGGLEKEVKEVFEMLKEKAKEAFKEHGQEAFSKVAKKEHYEHGHEGHGHHHEEEEEEEEVLTDVELRAALHLFTKAPYNLKITAKELECYVADFFEDYKPEEGAKIELEEFIDIVKEAEEQEEGEMEE